MSDLLRRLVGRALGQGSLVLPVVGTRFGREPELLSERSLDEGRPAALPGAGESRRALPPAAERNRVEALPLGGGPEVEGDRPATTPPARDEPAA